MQCQEKKPSLTHKTSVWYQDTVSMADKLSTCGEHKRKNGVSVLAHFTIDYHKPWAKWHYFHYVVSGLSAQNAAGTTWNTVKKLSWTIDCGGNRE